MKINLENKHEWGASTLRHITYMPPEKCREYSIPLCVAFVDYEKALDSVQIQAILTSLREQGMSLLNQNQNNLYSTHVVAVNKILLYSFKYGNSI